MTNKLHYPITAVFYFISAFRGLMILYCLALIRIFTPDVSKIISSWQKQKRLRFAALISMTLSLVFNTATYAIYKIEWSMQIETALTGLDFLYQSLALTSKCRISFSLYYYSFMRITLYVSTCAFDVDFHGAVSSNSKQRPTA